MLRLITLSPLVFAFNTAFADPVSGTIIGSIDRVMERDTPVQFKEGEAFSATFEAVDGKRVKTDPNALNYIWTQPNPDNDSSTIGTFTVRIDSTDIALMNASLGVMHDDGNDQFTIRVRCYSGNVCGFTGGMTSAAIRASKSKIPDPSPDVSFHPNGATCFRVNGATQTTDFYPASEVVIIDRFYCFIKCHILGLV